MTEKNIDCRGLACPAPVLKTKELIESGDISSLNVLVDNAAAKENVSRFLSRMGYEVSACGQQGQFTVTGTRREGSACEVTEDHAAKEEESRIAVVVGTDSMGKGDETLGRRLVINFIATLKEMGPELWRLILLNGGVKLAVEGAECLPELEALEKEGVRILVCGTCLNHFGLLEKKMVGETTNMLDVVTAMQVAGKTISVM